MESSERTVYSFSRISFECNYAFYRSYILEDKGIENAWSQGGSFLHELMEAVARKEISENDAYVRFISEWNSAVSMDFPQLESGFDLKQHYFKKMQPFFSRRKYWNGDVLSVEEHVQGELPSGHLFQGYIDLILGNTESFDIVDHKISKRFTKSDLAKKQRQLYIYAYLYHLRTGRYPKRLIFNFFQEPSNPIIIHFDRVLMKGALDWAAQRIETIENMKPNEYVPNAGLMDKDGKRNMFCMSLCNHRNNCPFVSGDSFVG